MSNVATAHVGDIAQCSNGHDLYLIKNDIFPGSHIHSLDFEPIGDAAKPGNMKPIEPCHLCGAPWITMAPRYGYVMCSIKRKLP